MGRTLSTFTQLVQQEVERWQKFRRALRKEDQQAFDELFSAARYHSAPGAYASEANPFEVMVLSMLLEQQKMLGQIRREIGLLHSQMGMMNLQTDGSKATGSAE